LRLRPYHPDDFDRLIEIDRACFQEGIAYSEEELRYYLHLPSAAALVGTACSFVWNFIGYKYIVFTSRGQAAYQ